MFSVIFDMDGTLLDTQAIYVPAWNICGEKQGHYNMGNHIPNVCGMNENGWMNYLKKNFPDLNTTEFKTDVFQYIKKNGKISFKKGAMELLEFLKGNNIKTAIASGSATADIISHLTELNAVDYFDAIVGGTDVENSKPAPDIFLKAASLLSAIPNECFVLEDSANGILAGTRAGMKCIGIPDMAQFNDDIKNILFAELPDLSAAIPIFEKYL